VALGWPDAELPIQFPSAGAALLAALAPRPGDTTEPAMHPKHAAGAGLPMVKLVPADIPAQLVTTAGGC
jgi:hypothetical protein